MSYLFNNPNQKSLRAKLRNNLGLPEIILWQQFKASKLGKKFRRQYGVGKYVLDFYAPEVRLGIELDGASHNNEEAYKYDQERDNFIQSQNVRIIRFQNKEVLNNLNAVIEEIKRNLGGTTPSPFG